jgi:hypothetical protein
MKEDKSQCIYILYGVVLYNYDKDMDILYKVGEKKTDLHQVMKASIPIRVGEMLEMIKYKCRELK